MATEWAAQLEAAWETQRRALAHKFGDMGDTYVHQMDLKVYQLLEDWHRRLFTEILAEPKPVPRITDQRTRRIKGPKTPRIKPSVPKLLLPTRRHLGALGQRV